MRYLLVIFQTGFFRELLIGIKSTVGGAALLRRARSPTVAREPGVVTIAACMLRVHQIRMAFHCKVKIRHRTGTFVALRWLADARTLCSESFERPKRGSPHEFCQSHLSPEN